MTRPDATGHEAEMAQAAKDAATPLDPKEWPVRSVTCSVCGETYETGDNPPGPVVCLVCDLFGG